MTGHTLGPESETKEFLSHLIFSGEGHEMNISGVTFLGGSAIFNEATDLTPRQQNVAGLTIAGASNLQIGQEFFRSLDTIRGDMKELYKKIGSASRSGLLYNLTTTAPTFMTIDTPIDWSLLSELSWRKHQILAEVGKGRTNNEIGDSLQLSQHTVKSYLEHTARDLGNVQRSYMAAVAVLSGLTSDRPVANAGEQF